MANDDTIVCAKCLLEPSVVANAHGRVAMCPGCGQRDNSETAKGRRCLRLSGSTSVSQKPMRTIPAEQSPQLQMFNSPAGRRQIGDLSKAVGMSQEFQLPTSARQPCPVVQP